jgi:hypothetical protein
MDKGEVRVVFGNLFLQITGIAKDNPERIVYFVGNP